MRYGSALGLLLGCVLVSCCQADQLPVKSKPFDGAFVDEFGGGTSGSANKTTGQLSASVHTRDISGRTRARVRWVYSYNGDQPCPATVAVKYDIQHGGLAVHCDDPTSGSAMASTALYVSVKDVTSGDCVLIYLENKGTAQFFAPFNFDGGYKGRQQQVTFKPNHTYHIDVVLEAKGLVYGGRAVNPMLTNPGGSADASASATVHSMKLITLQKPWICTTVDSVYSPTVDTYDAYERALQEATGRNYFEAGAWIEVSAGGSYDRDQSSVNVNVPDGRLVRLKDCSLAHSANGDHSINLKLPAYDSLPLEGKTWRFLAVVDPEYQTPGSERDFGPPVFRNLFSCLAATDLQLAAKGASSDAKSAPGSQSVTPQQFFDGANWCVVLPMKTFAAMFESSGPTRLPQTKPVTAPRDLDKLELNAGLWVPSNVEKPNLRVPGLQLQPVPQLNLNVERAEFTTEPVVILSVLELWRFITSIQGPQGLYLRYDLRWVRFLENLADDAKYWREWLDNMYLRLPSGELYKLTDLAGSIENERPAITVQGPDGNVPPIITPRMLRWIRRAAILGTAAKLVSGARPIQSGKPVQVSGLVKNSAGMIDQSSDARSFSVVFEFVPRQQPWPLAQPEAMPLN